MHYSLGGPEHFKDAPERARVRLIHDDGRQFFATDRTLGSDFWYIDGKKISKANTGMSSAIYHRTRVVARRSVTEPIPNWCTAPELNKAKEQKASPALVATQAHEAQRKEELLKKRRRYTSGKLHCPRHDAEYYKTYGCKLCRREQKAHGVTETVQLLPVDHVWGEIKSCDPETVDVCQEHGVSHGKGGECYKCVQEATPPVEEIRQVENVICEMHGVLHPEGKACVKCSSEYLARARSHEDKQLASLADVQEHDGREMLLEAPRLAQVGGSHYDSMPIDVFQFCEENGLGFVLSSAIKYIARKKGESRIEDLQKAISCIERQIKFEETGSWER